MAAVYPGLCFPKDGFRLPTVSRLEHRNTVITATLFQVSGVGPLRPYP